MVLLVGGVAAGRAAPGAELARRSTCDTPHDMAACTRMPGPHGRMAAWPAWPGDIRATRGVFVNVFELCVKND